MVTLDQVVSREKKKTVTFSISPEVNRKFIEIAERLNVNKSLLVEKAIIEFIDQYEEK